MAEMQTIIRGLPLEAKFAGGGEGAIGGYASTFGNVDFFGDIVAPGAFAKSLARHRADSTAPAMLWCHDQAEPIGRWDRLVEDDRGLSVAGVLNAAARRGPEARTLAKDGLLALSIGFVTITAARDKAGHRIIAEAELLEISLVAMPANPLARITEARSLAGAPPSPITAQWVERVLRGAGCPKALARSVIARGLRGAVDEQSTGDAKAYAAISEIVRAHQAHVVLITKGTTR
jgi:hypothetical protein